MGGVHIACPVPGVKRGGWVWEMKTGSALPKPRIGVRGGEKEKGGSGQAEGQRDGTAEVSEVLFIKARGSC